MVEVIELLDSSDEEEAGNNHDRRPSITAADSTRTLSDAHRGCNIDQGNFGSPAPRLHSPMQPAASPFQNHPLPLDTFQPSDDLQRPSELKSWVSDSDMVAKGRGSSSHVMAGGNMRAAFIIPPTLAEQVKQKGIASGPVSLRPVQMPQTRASDELNGSGLKKSGSARVDDAGSGGGNAAKVDRPMESTGGDAKAVSLSACASGATLSGSICPVDGVEVGGVDLGSEEGDGVVRKKVHVEKKMSRELAGLIQDIENIYQAEDDEGEEGDLRPRKRQKMSCVKQQNTHVAANGNGGRGEGRGRGRGKGRGRLRGGGRGPHADDSNQSIIEMFSVPIDEPKFPSPLAKAWAELFVANAPDKEECWPNTKGLMQGPRMRVFGLNLSPETTEWFKVVRSSYMDYLDSIGMLDLAYSVRPPGLHLLSYRPANSEWLQMCGRDGRHRSRQCPNRIPFLEVLEDLIVAIVGREVGTSDPTWREICMNLPCDLPPHPLLTSFVIPQDDPRVGLRGAHGVMYRGRGMYSHVKHTKGAKEAEVVASCIAHGAVSCPLIGVYAGDYVFRQEYTRFKLKPPPWFSRLHESLGKEIASAQWERDVNAYAVDLDSHTLEREDPFCCGFNAKVLAEETVEALEEMMIGVPPLLADMKSKKPAHADDLCFTISAFPHEDLHLHCVRGNITSALNDPTIDPLGMKQMPTRRVRKTSIVAVRLFGLQVQGGDVAGGFPFPLLVSQDDRFEVEGPGGIEEAGELTYLYGDDYWVSLREADLRLEALRDNM